ncbi:MAG: hypothetical protein ABFS45_09470 [Pseudomonadota bacterium]
MHITNRTNQDLYWIAREAAPGLKEPWQHLIDVGYEKIHPGQTHDNSSKITGGVKKNGIFLAVGKTKEAATRVGPTVSLGLKWGGSVLIVPTSDGDFKLTDWWSRDQKFIIHGSQLAKTLPDREDAAKVAENVLSGLSSALSTVPVPGGQIFSTIADVISNLVGLGAAPEPLPITEDKFAEIVGEVVRKELKRAEAEKASRMFYRVSQYLAEEDKLAASPDGLGPHETKDFHGHIEEYLSPQSDINQSFDFLHQHYDEALAICPAYLVGISAYVKMLIYHFLIGQMGGDPLVPDRLEKLKSEIMRIAEPLNTVIGRTQKLATSEMGDMAHLDDGIREVGQLRPAVHRFLIGLDNVEPIQKTFDTLVNIAKLIDQDVLILRKGEKKDLKDLHIFKQNWTHP